jgi:hypothetical protein
MSGVHQSDDFLTIKGMRLKEEDKLKLIQETIQLERDAASFLKEVVETKNFEQKQVEKKI